MYTATTQQITAQTPQNNTQTHLSDEVSLIRVLELDVLVAEADLAQHGPAHANLLGQRACVQPVQRRNVVLFQPRCTVTETERETVSDRERKKNKDRVCVCVCVPLSERALRKWLGSCE